MSESKNEIEIKKIKEKIIKLGDFLPLWVAAKTEFTTVTGLKKKKDLKGIATAFGHTGISESLKDCDMAIEAVHGYDGFSQKDYDKLVDAYKKTADGFFKAKAKYVKSLDAEINEQLKAQKKGGKEEKKESDELDPDKAMKGLKILKDALNAIEKKMTDAFDAMIKIHFQK